MTVDSWTNIFTALSKLMDVKSLVTIALTIGFIVMATRGSLTSEYQSVYLVVISFYFGTQYQKNQQESETDGTKNFYAAVVDDD